MITTLHPPIRLLPRDVVGINPVEIRSAIQLIKLRRLAEDSLYEFVQQAWHVLEPDTPFVPSWYIQVICEHLEAVTQGVIRRLLINIPPRHTKSLIVSVLWPMWVWIKYPSRKYLCASYSGTLSMQDSINARRLVQSDWYRERWGDRFTLTDDQNQKTRFENDKQGYRIATSVGGTGTGMGGNVLICDDPHSAKEAQSDVMRESALQWFDKTWSTRLNDPKKDAMVVIMQRLHEKDVSGHILEDIGGWEHVMIPAEFDGVRRKTVLGAYDPRKKKGELICPARFGPKEIVSLKKLLGVYGTAGQLQQDPTPAEGGILKTAFFELWPHDKGLPPFEYILQSYDTAFTDQTNNDPTACTVWAIFTYLNQHNVMLIDAWDEYLTYPELRSRAIKDWGTEYGGVNKNNPFSRARRPDRVLVESKASGISLLQDLRLGKVPAIAYNPGNADKISRAHQAAPTLELGIVWIPESKKNPGHPVSWAGNFIKQIAKFPTAEHDDYVDTFTQAIIYLKNDKWFELPEAKDNDEPRVKPKQRVNPYAA
jgi:predicted phage terminase large subunit-like protein